MDKKIIAIVIGSLLVSTFIFAETRDGDEWQKNVLEPMDELYGMSRDEKGRFSIEKYEEVADKDRMSSNEEMASHTLRTLSTGYQSYQFSEKVAPKSCEELANTNPPYIGNYMCEEEGAYVFKIIPERDGCYLIVGYPNPSKPPEWSGRYSFCIMEDNIVRVDKNGGSIESCNECNQLPRYEISDEERGVFMKER